MATTANKAPTTFMASKTIGHSGVLVEVEVGRIEAGRDRYSVPFYRDTVSGVVTNGPSPVGLDGMRAKAAEMATTHTPGPWHVFEPLEPGAEHSIGQWLDAEETKRNWLASVYPVRNAGHEFGQAQPCPEAAHNARLMAEAPRLRRELAALVEACEALPASDGRVIGLLPLVGRARKVLDGLA